MVFLLIFLFKSSFVVCEKIEIDSGDKKLVLPWDFTLTGDGIFLVPDQSEGNVKVYKLVGKKMFLVNCFGRKGIGFDEMIDPAYCFYESDTFGYLDFGKRKIELYDRISYSKFEKSKLQLSCERFGFDIGYYKEEVIVSGYSDIDSRGGCCLYYTSDDKKKCILPSYIKYSLFKENEERELELRKAIGTKSFFDIDNDNLYFAWEGSCRIIKIRLIDNKVSFINIEIDKYVNPIDEFFIKEQLELRKNNKFKECENNKNNKSFVKNVFCHKGFIYLILSNPITQKLDIVCYGLKNKKILVFESGFGCKSYSKIDKENNCIYFLTKKNEWFFERLSLDFCFDE